MLVDEDADLDSMTTHFNKAVTDTATQEEEVLGYSLIYVTKDETERRREASQKEPKTIEWLKERSGQSWR